MLLLFTLLYCFLFIGLAIATAGRAYFAACGAVFALGALFWFVGNVVHLLA
jgi:drug/metabolite transporter superfamily protein YnfA